MSECKPPRDPFIGSGRLQQGGLLATPKQTFNAHLGGDSGLRHCASHVNMSPPLPSPFTADDVQTTLELLAERSDGYHFYVMIGDGVNSTGDFTGPTALDDALSYIQVSGHESEVMVVVNPGSYTVTSSQATSSKIRLWGMNTGDFSKIPEITISTPTNDVYSRATFKIGSAENIKFKSTTGVFTSVSINATAGSDANFYYYLKNCVFNNVGFLFNGQRTVQTNTVGLSVTDCQFIHDITVADPLNCYFICNTVPDLIHLRNCQFLGHAYAIGIGTDATLTVGTASKYQNILIESCYFNLYSLENITSMSITAPSIVTTKKSYIWVENTSSTAKIINSKIKGVSETITEDLHAIGFQFTSKGSFISLKTRDSFISGNEIYGPNSYYSGGGGGNSYSLPTLYLEPQSNTLITNNVIKGCLPIQVSGTTAFSNVSTTNSIKTDASCIISNNQFSQYSGTPISVFGNSFISIDVSSSYENVKFNINNNLLLNKKAPGTSFIPEIINQLSTYKAVGLIQLIAEEAVVNINNNEIDHYATEIPIIYSPHLPNINGICSIYVATFTSAAAGESGSLNISSNNIYYNNQINAGTSQFVVGPIIAECAGPCVISGNAINCETNATFTSVVDRYFVSLTQLSTTSLNVPFIISGNDFFAINPMGASGNDGPPNTAPRNGWIKIVNGISGNIIGNAFSRLVANPNFSLFYPFEQRSSIAYVADSNNEVVCERNRNQLMKRNIRYENHPGDFNYFAYLVPGYKPSLTYLNRGGFTSTGNDSFYNIDVVTTNNNDISGFPGASLKISLPPNFPDPLLISQFRTDSARFRCYLDKLLPHNTELISAEVYFKIEDVSRWDNSSVINFDIYKSVDGIGFSDLVVGSQSSNQLNSLVSGVVYPLIISGPLSYKNITTNNMYLNLDFMGLNTTNFGAGTASIEVSSIEICYSY